MSEQTSGQLRIGWGHADITPDGPVLIAGQFPARVSEGVKDPITATALVLRRGAEHVVFVSCDLVAVSEELRQGILERLPAPPEGPQPERVIVNATHTHTAPEIRHRGDLAGDSPEALGVKLEVVPIDDYVAFAAERIARAIEQAWRSAGPGAVFYGLSHAVVGRNRRWVDIYGRAMMYGDTNDPCFSHIEGYEDHSVNVLATYSPEGKLTGVVVNLACPSQAEEHLYVISADFWHEVRVELRRRLGDGLFVLGQPSACGDQSPHVIYEKRAHERMLELKGISERQEIARRIADAVEDALSCAEKAREAAPQLAHIRRVLDLPARRISHEDARQAREEAEWWRKRYEEELAKLQHNPELRKKPRWYVPVTAAYRRMNWLLEVVRRYERQQQEGNFAVPVEVHAVRVGEAAFATNPYELYLDFGIYIKARSPAVQTFLVQLCGPAGYVPTLRSVAGGGYGSVPASTLVGPEGGRLLAERTVDMLHELWA